MSAKGLVIVFTLVVAACSAEAPTAIEPTPAGANGSSNNGDDAKGGDPSKNAGGTEKSGSDPGKGTPPPVGADAIKGCDDAPPASLPVATGEFLVGKTTPTPKGGDEKGTWIVTKVTAYFPQSASFFVDVNASSAEGKGFLKFDGTRFLSFSDVKMTLATKISGKVVSATSATVAGKYTYANGQLGLTAECQKTSADQKGDPPKSTGFSRLSDTEALLLQTGDSQFGEVTLAFSLKKGN